ncbi:hypothetical protein QJS04_geneDACA004419 [Acorus gramineus]|uniref:Uncharacterized protein n=1 Tax=Acorus gramineus TaxID=55184 RepID=A0AAV9B2H6_ACOGR|nr:hypothetical protein QJS04_geneDACA004419 [Acorus gramineus]
MYRGRGHGRGIVVAARPFVVGPAIGGSATRPFVAYGRGGPTGPVAVGPFASARGVVAKSGMFSYHAGG